MSIGILSYPMLFQREGSLQIQIRETIRALNRLESLDGEGISVELVDPCRSRLDTYDLIHVFAAVHGNHCIVEAAAGLGVPVILSPLISPGSNRSSGTRARVADRLLGNLTASYLRCRASPRCSRCRCSWRWPPAPPVVDSSGSELDLPDSAFALKTVGPGDTTGIKRAVMGLIGQPPKRTLVRSVVSDYTWERIAQRIARCYAEVVAGQPARVAPAGVVQRAAPSISRLYTGP